MSSIIGICNIVDIEMEDEKENIEISICSNLEIFETNIILSSYEISMIPDIILIILSYDPFDHYILKKKINSNLLS
jgi:hypothetical protein